MFWFIIKILQMRQTEKIIQAQKESDLVILAGIECDFTLRYGLDLPSKVISVNRNPEKGTLVNLFKLFNKF